MNESKFFSFVCQLFSYGFLIVIKGTNNINLIHFYERLWCFGPIWR